MAKLLLLVAGVAAFQPTTGPALPATQLQWSKTAKELRQKYPNAGAQPVKYVLTKNAPPYGNEGDVLKVSRGFAVNYLTAKELGVPASAEVIAADEVKKAAEAAADAAAYDAAANVAQGLAGLDLKIVRALGEDGDVGAVDVADVLQVLTAAASGDVSKAKVKVPAISSHGDYPVTVELHKKLKIELTLSVVEA